MFALMYGDTDTWLERHGRGTAGWVHALDHHAAVRMEEGGVLAAVQVGPARLGFLWSSFQDMHSDAMCLKIRLIILHECRHDG